MSEALKQMEENQIKNLEEKTGKKIGDWISIVKESGLEKHGALVSMLKEKYQMGHGYANLVVHHALQSHAGFAEEEDLISGQYKGKENLRPMYEQLMKEILAFGKDVELSPKKSIRQPAPEKTVCHHPAFHQNQDGCGTEHQGSAGNRKA